MVLGSDERRILTSADVIKCQAHTGLQLVSEGCSGWGPGLLSPHNACRGYCTRIKPGMAVGAEGKTCCRAVAPESCQQAGFVSRTAEELKSEGGWVGGTASDSASMFAQNDKKLFMGSIEGQL